MKTEATTDGKIDSKIKLEVTTHSGETDIVEVEEYNVQEVTDLRNGEQEAIAIGNHSYSRIDIKNIKPVQKHVE